MTPDIACDATRTRATAVVGTISPNPSVVSTDGEIKHAPKRLAGGHTVVTHAICIVLKMRFFLRQEQSMQAVADSRPA